MIFHHTYLTNLFETIFETVSYTAYRRHPELSQSIFHDLFPMCGITPCCNVALLGGIKQVKVNSPKM
jgi:hypothetical protein